MKKYRAVSFPASNRYLKSPDFLNFYIYSQHDPDRPKDRNTGPILVTYGESNDAATPFAQLVGHSCPNQSNTFIAETNKAGYISFFNQGRDAYLCKDLSDASKHSQ